MTEHNYSTAYSTAPGFLGIKAQRELDHRYLTEDVGYSLVFLADLAARIGVPTPVIDAVIPITSVVLARDFRGEACAPSHARPAGPLPRGPRRALSARLTARHVPDSRTSVRLLTPV